MAKGIIKGTTPSGHPNKTTLGNTIRIIIFWKFLAYKCSIEWGKDIGCLQCGDDTVLFINPIYLEKYKEQLDRYSKDESKMPNDVKQVVDHGLGLQYKGFTVTYDRTNFLSKEILVCGNINTMLRNATRSIFTGSSYDPQSLTSAELNWSVTEGLKSWIGDLPGYKQILTYRQKLKSKKPGRHRLERFRNKFENSRLDTTKHGEHYYGFEPALYTNKEQMMLYGGGCADAVRQSVISAP